MMRVWRASALALVIFATGLAAAHAQAGKPELTNVRLSVGGKPGLFYLPLTLTERLGYFKDAGLAVEISDFAGGGKALESLIGGSADVVTGAFDHTIQMQAKKQPLVAVVELGRFPGFVLGVLSAKAQAYRGPQDLKGMKIGVSAAGSSTQFMAQHLMVRAGLAANDASFIGVGASAGVVAAVERGEIDAVVNVDPVISLLQQRNLIKVVADTRTAEGSRAVYGGDYPAAVLYVRPAFTTKNPATTQALVDAFVRGLKWIQGHSPAEIAAVMPSEYALGDKALYVKAIAASMGMYSPDGRLSRAGAETVYTVLREFDPMLRTATIDLDATYTNAFVDKAPKP